MRIRREMEQWRKHGDVSIKFATAKQIDAICVSDGTTRTSISGVVVMLHYHWANSWSTVRSFIALFSAEFWPHASIKATVAAFGVQSMAGGFKNRIDINIMADASAALGVSWGNGLGIVRHLGAGHLPIQETRAKFEKTFGIANGADMVIKDVVRGDIGKHIEFIGYCHLQGKA